MLQIIEYSDKEAINVHATISKAFKKRNFHKKIDDKTRITKFRNVFWRYLYQT